MTKRFLTLFGALFAMLTTTGCGTINTHVFDQANKKDTGVLCIGMERSAKYGSCPGAQVDATRMFNILKGYSDNAMLYVSQEAKRTVVIQKFQEICQKDLAILFFSGHGGDQKQSSVTKQNFVEPTGKDQFLCLYDGMLLDDEIWSIICGAKGRVVLIFDCCHSGSMYRDAITFEIQLKNEEGTFGAGAEPNMICISGCPDNSYSYGDTNGGLLTNAFLTYFKESRTYNDIWKLLHNDKYLNKSEEVQFTELGKSFKDYLIFR